MIVLLRLVPAGNGMYWMYKPDLVTIFFGHNDAHGGREGLAPFIQAVGDLVHRIRSETEADILLMTPCMMMSRGR